MAVTGRYLFTQPESLLAIVAVVLIYFASHLESDSLGDVLLRFLHLSSFSLYVGMSFWVTFIAGLSMYRILPRHLFSQVQSVLFPKFVMYCMVFSTVSLVTYYMHIKNKPDEVVRKIFGLSVCVFASTASCLVINPLVNAIDERNKMEVLEKVGQGIGNDNEGVRKLQAANEEYAKLYSRVVKLHGGSAFINLISLVGIAVHLSVLSYNVTFN